MCVESQDSRHPSPPWGVAGRLVSKFGYDHEVAKASGRRGHFDLLYLQLVHDSLIIFISTDQIVMCPLAF